MLPLRTPGRTWAARLLRPLASVLVAGLAVGPLHAEDAPTRYALLVGIDRYSPYYGVGSLNVCVNDATGVRDRMLLADPGQRWPAANLSLLTNSGATRTAIRAALQDLASHAVAGDLVLYFHSSHGGQYSGTSTFLCTYNADYPDTEVAADLALFDSGVNVVTIVDTCFSAGLFMSRSDTWPFADCVMAHVQAIKAAGGQRDLGSNLAFMTACDWDEYSYTGSHYSTYTNYVVAACSQDSVDTSGNGEFAFSEIHAYATPRATADESTQHPQSWNDALLAALSARASGTFQAFAPSDTTGDWAIDGSEFAAYTVAWQTGAAWTAAPSPVPIAYLTRTGYLRRQGGAYTYDADLTAPLCWVSAAGASAPHPTGNALAREILDSGTARPLAILTVSPATGTSAYAVEESVPAGLTPVQIGQDGTWSATQRQIKWGPFLDDSPRSLTYGLVGPTGTYTLTGTASFDGTDTGATGATDVQVTNDSGRILRAASGAGLPGSLVRVAIDLVAQGDENRLQFGLAFDPDLLAYQGTATSDAPAGAVIGLSEGSAAAGQLGVTLALPAGETFPVGTTHAVVVTFTAAAVTEATTTAVELTDLPLAREVRSTAGGLLATTFANGTVTLRPGGVTVTPLTGLQTTEAGGTAQVRVVLGARPAAAVRIGIGTSDASEGAASPAYLVFTAGNWNSPQTVTVTGVDDVDADGDVTYTVTTAPTVSADASFRGLDAADPQVTNAEDAFPEWAGAWAGSCSLAPTRSRAGAAGGWAVAWLTAARNHGIRLKLATGEILTGQHSPADHTFTAAGHAAGRVDLACTGSIWRDLDDADDDGDTEEAVVSALLEASDSRPPLDLALYRPPTPYLDATGVYAASIASLDPSAKAVTAGPAPVALLQVRRSGVNRLTVTDLVLRRSWRGYLEGDTFVVTTRVQGALDVLTGRLSSDARGQVTGFAGAQAWPWARPDLEWTDLTGIVTNSSLGPADGSRWTVILTPDAAPTSTAEYRAGMAVRNNALTVTMTNWTTFGSPVVLTGRIYGSRDLGQDAFVVRDRQLTLFGWLDRGTMALTGRYRQLAGTLVQEGAFTGIER